MTGLSDLAIVEYTILHSELPFWTFIFLGSCNIVSVKMRGKAPSVDKDTQEN
jgi:hypothetical protein